MYCILFSGITFAFDSLAVDITAAMKHSGSIFKIMQRASRVDHILKIGTLSKRGRQCQRRETRKIFLRNPRILLNISALLWLSCMFLFSLKFRSAPERNDACMWTVVLEMSATF